jgi:DNA replication protein DnaC
MSGGDVSVLLSHHLKELRLPVFLREYRKVAAQCAKEKHDLSHFLLQLSELELIEREKKGAERRVREAGFPVLKTLDGFDFTAIPSLNKRLVMELARGEYFRKRENVLAVGNSGTGKTHVAIALGLAACHEGHRVRFFTAAGLVTALSEARDDRALLRFQKQLSRKELVIVDEFGYVPFSKIGAELLFEFFAERYERGSVMVTTNLPFDQWTEVLGSERLTGALLDRLTHRVHILEMNGESYRFKESARRLGRKTSLPKRTEEREEPEEKEKSEKSKKSQENGKSQKTNRTKEKNEEENKFNDKKSGEI